MHGWLRRAGRLVALLLLGATTSCGAFSSRPNVIVYVVDTLRADHLSHYGYERETSPRLTDFAREAVTYDQAYAPSSWTRPSTASLLTGRYPLAHGAIKRADAIAPDVPMLGEVLQRAGYTTAAFSTNVNVLPVWGFDRGFDHFYDVDSETWTARSEQVNEEVLKHLDAHPDQPFFLYIHTRDPHVPYRPPPPFDAFWPAGKNDDVVNRYDGEIRANDHFFGLLMKELARRGLYDESLILFTSDHGEEMLDRGKVGHGYSLFEEVVGIPFLIKYPGNVDGGIRLQGPASLIDVVPTVLGVVGLDVPEGVEGVNLRARSPGLDRELFFDLNLLLQGERYVLDGVKRGSHKLLDQVEPQRRRMLFDLDEDPGERASVTDGDPKLERELEELLVDFRAEARSGLQLALIGGEARGERRAELRLRTDGRFTGLRGIELEEGDAVTLEEQGRVLRFDASLPSRDNPAGGTPEVLVDSDRAVVEVEPPGSVVEVERVVLGGEPGEVFLGAQRRPAGGTGARFRRDEPGLAVERMDTLLPIDDQRSVSGSPGLYVGTVSPRGTSVSIDAETERRLRELGYAE